MQTANCKFENRKCKLDFRFLKNGKLKIGKSAAYLRKIGKIDLKNGVKMEEIEK